MKIAYIYRPSWAEVTLNILCSRNKTLSPSPFRPRKKERCSQFGELLPPYNPFLMILGRQPISNTPQPQGRLQPVWPVVSHPHGHGDSSRGPAWGASWAQPKSTCVSGQSTSGLFPSHELTPSLLVDASWGWVRIKWDDAPRQGPACGQGSVKVLVNDAVMVAVVTTINWNTEEHRTTPATLKSCCRDSMKLEMGKSLMS